MPTFGRRSLLQQAGAAGLAGGILAIFGRREAEAVTTDITLKPGENVLISATAGQTLTTARNTAKTRVRVTSSGTISPEPTPTPDPTLVFSDDFTTWDPTRYFVYPATWTNNYTGHYDPTIISSDGSKLRVNLHTSGGFPRIAAFCPIPTGALSARGDLLGMKVEFRIRADLMPGYKGVPLLWPMSGLWPQDGEIDAPESEFDKPPAIFMHRQGATTGSDQDYYGYPPGTSWQDWHTYATEWTPGVSAEFFLDGLSVGKSTARVPNTAMHLVMQFETRLNMTPPDPAVSGYVEIDYLKVWSR